MTAKIKLNAASGGGSFSLQAPSSSSNNRVFTLPDVANGTLLTSSTSTGKILQVVATNVSATSSVSLTNHSTLYATPCTVNITSIGTNSKFLITGAISGEGTTGDHDYGFVTRRTIGGSGSSINVGASSGSRIAITRTASVGFQDPNNDSTSGSSHIAPYLDSPSQAAGTTITYSFDIIEHGTNNNTTFYFNRTVADGNNAYHERPSSYITVMEVAA